MNIINFDCLPSTNDYLKENYSSLPDNTLIKTTIQTKGRGRFDRVWKSTNDLTFSILKKEKASYTILAPLVIVTALRSFGYETMIKWPNDILYQDRKLAGILIEDIYQKDWCCSIIGIGINLSKKKEDDFLSSYVDIDEDELLDRIIQTWNELIIKDHHELMELYHTYAYLLHKHIAYAGKTWNVIGFTNEGFLKIEQDGHQKILHSEEISLQQIYEEVSK